MAQDAADTSAGTRADHGVPARLLGIWAHPDDEAYLAAGLMDRVVGSGGSVTTVTITDGEGGFGEDDPRSADERAGLRRAELGSAMAAIGVTDVRFLGVPDGSVAAAPVDGLVARLATVIEDVRPEVVVTFGPDGITGHPDHVATWRLASRAWLECGRGRLWCAAKTDAWLDEWRAMHDQLGVWMTEEPTGVRPEDVDLGLELAGRALDRKRAVLAEHASQTAGLVEAIGEARYRRWIRSETFRHPTRDELVAVGGSRGAGGPSSASPA